uniref:Uncharacterized protein n=1 Tax=Knipowitschia caucasica TaxID=637954 RepID=A0AAV2LSJ3_KNICA
MAVYPGQGNIFLRGRVWSVRPGFSNLLFSRAAEGGGGGVGGGPHGPAGLAGHLGFCTPGFLGRLPSSRGGSGEGG